MGILKIDWTVMWKFFHYQFCGIYLGSGILIRLVFAGRLNWASPRKTSAYALASSSVSAALNTWFPIVPIIGGVILINFVGQGAVESVPIGVPIVAASMGLEALLVDPVLFRVLLKEPVRGRLGGLVAVDMLNAVLAMVLGLVWAYRHMPFSIARLPW